MTTAIRKTIIMGPSKMDLMLALFDTPNGEARQVTFQTSSGNYYALYVTSVQAEDGSRESWNISAGAKGLRFTIYYRTDSRKGSLVQVVL